MNIHAVLITYALDPTELVESFIGDDVTLHLFTHSAIPEVTDACLRLARKYPDIALNDYRENRGLARSWNDGIAQALEENAEAIIVVNDDIKITNQDFHLLAEQTYAHPEAGIIVANGFNVRMDAKLDLGYSIFGINPIAINEVGYFDAAYWPIYGEDVDYSRRMTLAKVPFHSVGDTDVVHTGSATVASVPVLAAQNTVTFKRNEIYHRAKHGGTYGQEVFLHPFNNPALSWHISVSEMDMPYYGHTWEVGQA